MILRKPYAFLIRHFKMIHIFLVLIMGYLIYRTHFMVNFLNEYISANQTSTVENITNIVFNIWMFALPFLIIALSVIIISLMSEKKKPIFLYIWNIILSIIILVMYNLSFSVMSQMEATLMESRTIRLFRDFITILDIIQCISLVFVLIRATGFDIKKFDFGKDLAELEITEADNEEFEVNLEVETNEVERKAKRFWRFLKYLYYEHQFLCDLGILLVFSGICFAAYMNAGIYKRDVQESSLFSTTSFYLGVNNSYITSQDYKGKAITENTLIVLDLKIRSKGVAKQLDVAMTSLKIENRSFYPIKIYKDDLMDLGHTYLDSEIPTTFEHQLLVFEIPKKLENEEMIFTYTDKIDYISNGINSKYIKVKVKPRNIDAKPIERNNSITKTQSFKNSILKNSEMKIETVEIQKEFKENYQFCISDHECYPSIEYVQANYNSNDEKALMKITGTLKLDEEVNIKRIYSLAHFIYYFSDLKYEENGQVKTQKVTMNQIKPKKIQNKNTYYIEVSEDVLKAEKVWLDFHIRDYDYLYQIK